MALKRLKPQHLSPLAIAGLATQFIVAAWAVFAVIAMWLGLLGPNEARHIVGQALIGLCAFALLVAGVAIWADRWWGYFLEAAVLGSAVAGMLVDPDSPLRRLKAPTIPVDWLQTVANFMAVFNALVYLSVIWQLVQTGRRRYQEQRRGVLATLHE